MLLAKNHSKLNTNTFNVQFIENLIPDNNVDLHRKYFPEMIKVSANDSIGTKAFQIQNLKSLSISTTFTSGGGELLETTI